MPGSIRRATGALLSSLLVVAYASSARGDHALSGPALVGLLGDHALHVFAPRSGRLGALVTLPDGVSAASLGLEPFTSRYGRLHGSPGNLVTYATAHPDLEIEVAPPLHTLLDQAGRFIGTLEAHARLGLDGTGILVGVADTGLDVTLPDFRDPATGQSRVAWLLDLSLPPANIYPDLEAQFCAKAADGTCQSGAVLAGPDIDALIASHGPGIPIDEYGHGTHVTSIAAGNGGPTARYVGGAPGAQIVFARIVRDRFQAGYAIENDDLLTGIAFLFERADAMKRPMVANLSLGTDFGPHDGSLSWEKAIAGYVGDDAPGRAIAVAAGNSGSIVLTPIHQVVGVPSGGVVSVPIETPGSSNGSVQVWLTFTAGSNLRVGLDGPDGTWIPPVQVGQVGNDDSAGYVASIVNGASATCTTPTGGSCQIQGAEIPSGSNGAVVVWDANGGAGWPGGEYRITLQGSGTADLWLSSDVAFPDGTGVGFANGVREGTINLPGTEPSILSVGCTVSRTRWTSIDDAGWALTTTPGLDPAGGLPGSGPASFASGDVCWFSSAGPNALGVPKPEVSAPGAFVIAAMSSQAAPGSSESIFTSAQCLDGDGGIDPLCMQVDPQHAVAEGTSMSSPMVAGAVALMLQKDPTLTESEIVPLLQGGLHFFRSGPVAFEDQSGPGELDVVGSLSVMDLMSDPILTLPTAATSWITLSSDYVLADGSIPTVAIVELRAQNGAAADLFKESRLAPVASVDGAPLVPTPRMTRHGPGVWSFSVRPPAGMGGSALTFGATFDGEPIVSPKTVPIATDPWTATYPSEAAGTGSSCAVAGEGRCGSWSGSAGWLTLGLVARRRRRSARSR